ncbi:hypothetical protein F5B22DRAFT_657929 [Xylaria bambusicola]|uniref:uncharacterized protein n=1 Tax=Xylaria bambusicola TaxID=326684 RepID=UPI00200795AA|nr:uncharacterized protein F5B22DRAFT_657929 [Xylaria bambusicola]KAI0509743.1 hypothetical protein F5B22DRAFT_657929 [Xylaria bambusicola]
MDKVPVELFRVPLFEPEWVRYDERPECTVFAVKSKVQPHFRFKIWWKKEGHEQLSKCYKGLSKYEEQNYHGGFVNGLPIIELSVPVRTCIGCQRPKILYRVVHDAQPHYGIKARGYGLVHVTPLHFQLLVANHMEWRCRDPSPFMSTTDSLEKVRQIIRIYQSKGMTGIRVHKFRSNGPEWEQEVGRLFHVPKLGYDLHNLHYRTCHYMQREYLLESHIPPESIIETTEVEDIPYESPPPSPKKRKAVEDDSEEEKKRMPSGKRCTGFKRES